MQNKSIVMIRLLAFTLILASLCCVAQAEWACLACGAVNQQSYCTTCDEVNPQISQVSCLPIGLKTIEEEAFYGDESLQIVQLADGVQSIGARAFANSSLKQINIPASITYIGEGAFEGCIGLKVLTSPGSYGEQWWNCNKPPRYLVIKAYSPGNESSVITRTLIKYAELVNNVSGGTIIIDVHHSGEYGNDKDAISAACNGEIDILFTDGSSVAAIYQPARMLDLPFLFSNEEQAYEAFNSDAGSTFFAGLHDYGLIYLAEGDAGMRHIAATNHMVHIAADVKKLKIAVPPSQIYLDVWETLGATPVAVSAWGLPSALSSGRAEAVDYSTYRLLENSTYDDIRYYSNINYMWNGFSIVINKDTWDRLDPNIQTILKEQAKVAAKYSFDIIADKVQSATGILQQAGVQFDFTPDIASFRDALGGDAFYYRYAYESWFDQNLFEMIRAATKN